MMKKNKLEKEINALQESDLYMVFAVKPKGILYNGFYRKEKDALKLIGFYTHALKLIEERIEDAHKYIIESRVE